MNVQVWAEIQLMNIIVSTLAGVLVDQSKARLVVHTHERGRVRVYDPILFVNIIRLHETGSE